MDWPELRSKCSIFTDKEKEEYMISLDGLDGKIDWVTINSLLQIEGMDRAKVLKKSLNYFDRVFYQKRQTVCVSYNVEEGGFVPVHEELNNAEEVLKIVNQFLSFEEIPEEDKIILKGIILRNFNVLINKSYYTMHTLENLIKIGLPIEEILNNKQTIVDHINGIDLFSFNAFCERNNSPLDIALDDIVLRAFWENVNVVPDNFLVMSEEERKKFEIGIFAIKKVIEELLERQGLDLTEVAYIASGAYSDTIRVGDFVLKIGKARANKQTPYSKHIIKPLISYMVNGRINLEVQNLVDAKWWEIKDEDGNIIRELSEEEIEEEMFRLYCSLRKDGIAWKDIKRENVGRLLKRNSSNFEVEYTDTNGDIGSYEMNIADEQLGIVGRVNGENEILSAGELVIIDRDHLNGKGVYNPKLRTMTTEESFKKRYESIEK